MAPGARSRASIYEALSPLIGEHNANDLMSEFPSIEADELVTKHFLRAELEERSTVKRCGSWPSSERRSLRRRRSSGL